MDVVFLISDRTSKSTQPYQRGRASITGLKLNLETGMKTGRLIGVACLVLFCIFFIRTCGRDHLLLSKRGNTEKLLIGHFVCGV
jgi:hypothetical protein